MGTSAYAVVCELGLQHFDDPRAGRVAAGAVLAQVRRGARADERVGRSSLRRRGHLGLELAVEVRAPSSWQALEVATGLLDASFAATGHTPVDWSQVRPEVSSVPDRPRSWHLAGRRERTVVTRPPAPTTGWAEVAALARRLAAPAVPLPPLAHGDCPGPPSAPHVGAVIDLR